MNHQGSNSVDAEDNVFDSNAGASGPASSIDLNNSSNSHIKKWYREPAHR